jgi:hypothetical protein
MMQRRDRVELISAYAYGPGSTDPETAKGKQYARELLEMLRQRVHRHLRDLDMTEHAPWRKVDGEFCHEVEHRRACLREEEKFLNELSRGRNL